MANTKLKLYFKDQENKSKTVAVDYPKESYNPTEVQSAMDAMLASDVLVTKNGPVSSKEKAELETVTREEIALE